MKLCRDHEENGDGQGEDEHPSDHRDSDRRHLPLPQLHPGEPQFVRHQGAGRHGRDVGTLGLPIAAIFISLVFSRYFQRKELAAELPHRRLRFVVIATRYVVPIVLVIVTVSTVIWAVL